MKKSLLSIVLCVALLVTAMGTMLAMPASAASGVDYFVGTNNPNAEGVNYTVENGVLTFNATAAGQEVALVAETPANLNNYPFIELTISSTGAFDLCFNDANNNKWIGGASDFNYNFDSSDYEKLPAGDYDVKFDLTGAYTWDGSALPANAEICQVIFIAEEPGTITVTKCQITDGMTEVDLNTRGDQSEAKWDKTINILAGDTLNVPAVSGDVSSDVKVTKNDDGSVTFGNTNGLWPAAVYDFSKDPIVVNKSAALNIDFTVAAGYKTTIYLFMGETGEGKNGSTHEEFGKGTYLWIADMEVPDQVMQEAEMGVGHYSGTIFLEDIYDRTIKAPDLAESVKNANGDYVINGIKIHATSADGSPATDNAVTVNKFEVVSLADDAEMPSTTKKEDKTTTTLGQATQGANGNTTTVNNGGAAGGNSASTGDVSEAALFIVVAAAAAAVVTLSVVSKKAKSR